MEMFQKLIEYKKVHKSTIVPRWYKEDLKLGLWVKKQRSLYKNDNMKPNRLALLNSIDFVWKVDNDERWMEMFQNLVEYKKKHKNTLVPTKYKENPQLGTWVHTQRKSHKNGHMEPNRLALLNSIDFDWKASDEQWMIMFQKLVIYNKLHKNTLVPRRYKKDVQLGNWVSKQRFVYNNDDMKSNRLALLNSIDFAWNIDQCHSQWV